jgi:glycosyltransferase involved in cell wall biosynthesis
VLDNPVELEPFDRAQPDPQAYGLGPTDLSVFFIGQLKPIKGVEVFLDAAQLAGPQVPQARFILIGDSTDEAYSSHIARRAEAIPNVRWMRFTSEIERAWDEPFGRIAIEAGAAGKPIVCTSVGGIPEIVRNGENGLLVPRDDPAQLSAAIVSLLKNPELRRQLGMAGRVDAERRFAAPVVTRRLAQLLQPLLGAPATNLVSA